MCDRNVFASIAFLLVAGSLHSLPAAQSELITREVSLGKVLPTALAQSMVVSPDQKRIAYVAIRSGKSLAVVDGIEGKIYDRVMTLGFSPDGKHVAYVGRRGENLLVVLDGKEG